jgi:hypothetical protein
VAAEFLDVAKGVSDRGMNQLKGDSQIAVNNDASHGQGASQAPCEFGRNGESGTRFKEIAWTKEKPA